MKFAEIGRNLLNEGMKYKWGQRFLIHPHFYNGLGDKEPTYCALGIKAVENGVPNVCLVGAVA